MSILPNNFLITLEEIQAIEAVVQSIASGVQADLPLLEALAKGSEDFIDHLFHPTLVSSVFKLLNNHVALSNNQTALSKIVAGLKNKPVSPGNDTVV